MFQADPEKAKRKLAFFTELALAADVVLVQETHGNADDFLVKCPQLAGLFATYVSQGPSRATGGVLTLFRKTWLAVDAVVTPRVLAEGRVLRTSITAGDKTCHVWNVHNFDLTGEQMADIEEQVHQDVRETSS